MYFNKVSMMFVYGLIVLNKSTLKMHGPQVLNAKICCLFSFMVRIMSLNMLYRSLRSLLRHYPLTAKAYYCHVFLEEKPC